MANEGLPQLVPPVDTEGTIVPKILMPDFIFSLTIIISRVGDDYEIIKK
jgi:hypothetical protein